MLAEDAIDIGLVMTTTAYAFWLDDHKHQEPDWTWLEVVAGVGIVLIAAGARSRVQAAATWRTHEQNVWRAFVLGGLPIICGEISQAIRGWRDRDAYRKRQWETNGHVRTSEMAGWSRTIPSRRG